jgi:two-component system, chemotaxis family, protein-glutamate methylesterase/glutaminase
MPEGNKIKVLIIDDSLFMRQMLSDILNSDPDIKVIGTANDGEEGLAKIKELKPDVVTLDYEMPGLDGLAVLKKIMHAFPTPVVMVSAYTPNSGHITLEALDNGAIDYILKPSGPVSLDLSSVKDEIINRVKVASKVSVEKLKDFLLKKSEKLKIFIGRKPLNKIVVIGSSTGGTRGVELILRSLPTGLSTPIVIVQHMPSIFTALFADRLNKLTDINVKEGMNREEVTAGNAYVAPGGLHMQITLEFNDTPSIKLTKDPPVFGLRPSVDILMTSVVKIYGKNSIGVLLSGMGSDGVKGMEQICEAGGVNIAQDEKTSIIFGMPRRAIEAGVVDDILPIDKIAGRIVELISNY